METSLNRKRQIEEHMAELENSVDKLAQRVESLNPYRNTVIEEVAQHIEEMQGFGADTISSFAIYIRSLKS
jgi:uncharacterized protein Yka (UPF0111/DUF47 family)